MADESEQFPDKPIMPSIGEVATRAIERTSCALEAVDKLSAMLAIEYARQGKSIESYEDWQLANACRVHVRAVGKTTFACLKPNKLGS